MPTRADLVTRFARAMIEGDREALESLVHPGYIGDAPQSGERVRGFDQFMAQLEQYPGDVDYVEDDGPTDLRVVGDEEGWALTPGYSIVPLANPNQFTVVGRMRYPDGVVWHIVMHVEMRDERLYRSETYFAPEMQAPILASMGTAPQAP